VSGGRSADLVRRPEGSGSATRRQAGRGSGPFGTGHLLFARLDRTYEAALDRAIETLSVRYAMDFRKPAERYCALGTPQMVAERIRAFHAAGVRHVVLDLLGPYEQKAEQIAWFARDALPLLDDLTTSHSRSRSAPGGTP
jgi:alkanesulfonate monooxygenase SsuD/methylene tetrahydromethanopterin reductase-like flavin-dependent oxidoreductase (luciferase family)